MSRHTETDFADAEAIGTRLVTLLREFGALNKITPGLVADWGLEVGGTVFAFAITVATPEQIATGGRER